MVRYYEDDYYYPRRPRYRTRPSGKRYPVESKVQVIRPSLAKPYDITSVTRDGRRFNLRILARSETEAIEIAMNKFPLITVTGIKKSRLSSADRLSKARTLGRGIRTLGRTASRIARWLDTESAEERRLAEEEGKRPEEERGQGVF